MVIEYSGIYRRVNNMFCDLDNIIKNIMSQQQIQTQLLFERNIIQQRCLEQQLPKLCNEQAIQPKMQYYFATDLKQKFVNKLFDIKKATNAPKFLLNCFLKHFSEYLPTNLESNNHKKWLKRFEQNLDKKVISRFHLIEIFGFSQNQKQHNRNKINRDIFRKILSDLRKYLILDNNMIPQKNKVQYLCFSKIYQWRLNDETLVGRFN